MAGDKVCAGEQSKAKKSKGKKSPGKAKSSAPRRKTYICFLAALPLMTSAQQDASWEEEPPPPPPSPSPSQPGWYDCSYKGVRSCKDDSVCGKCSLTPNDGGNCGTKKSTYCSSSPPPPPPSPSPSCSDDDASIDKMCKGGKCSSSWMKSYCGKIHTGCGDHKIDVDKYCPKTCGNCSSPREKMCKDVDSGNMMPCSQALCQDKASGKIFKCTGTAPPAGSAAASTEALLLLHILVIMFSLLCVSR